MKIAITRRYDACAPDGVNRFIYNLARGFGKLGVETAVLAYTCRGDPKHLFDTDTTVYTIGGRLGVMATWLIKGPKALKTLGVDAVITNGVVPIRFKGVKIAVNHGNAIFELRKSVIKRAAAKALYRQYDYVICVSQKVFNEMREVGLECDAVVPIPLDIERYKPSEEREPVVLHVGTSQRKRPDISIKTVEILRKRGYDIKLILIGRYNIHKEWATAKEGVSDKELQKLMAKATALIHPSEWEGLPYVVLEAQASGTPVIVGPGVPDEALIDGKTGWKINSHNPEHYADALQTLLDDKELWRQMSKEARTFVEKFRDINIAKQYIELIRK